MKKTFELKDKKIIQNLLDEIDFGTLALCKDNIPYSVPLNFVYVEDNFYFHGAKKGKKVDFFTHNAKASFCVAKEYSFIPSYFSSEDNKACPATQFFKSIICDGEIKIIKDYDEKILAMQKLMEKLQSEGKYIALDKKEVYEKMINATLIYKLVPNDIKAKFKFGQNLSQKRFKMVLKHLKQRNTNLDKKTLNMMKNI